MYTDRPLDTFVTLLFEALALGTASGCNTLAGIEDGVLDSSPCAPLEDPATGHCYLLEQDNKLPWASAGQTCAQFGGTLAALTSAEELILVSPLIRASTWIGGSDLAMHDTYAWSNGEPWWSQAPWGSGQPDSEDDKHCVKLSPEPPIAFENARCTSKLAYLCEKP